MTCLRFFHCGASAFKPYGKFAAWSASRSPATQTFTFRLADGSPLVVTIWSYFKTHSAELFRSLRAKHGWVELVSFDARADDHPDVIMEHEELRRRMHEARVAAGWTPRGRASA